jgi:hypothetical protein
MDTSQSTRRTIETFEQFTAENKSALDQETTVIETDAVPDDLPHEPPDGSLPNDARYEADDLTPHAFHPSHRRIGRRVVTVFSGYDGFREAATEAGSIWKAIAGCEDVHKNRKAKIIAALCDDVNPHGKMYFYGNWTAKELALHINIKEALASWWAMVIFGELTPTFCASLRTSRTYPNERIDNTVAIAAAAKNSAKEWMMQQIVAKRAEAQRATGWTYSQQYIASKLNDLADPLSRGRLDSFMENARKRGLTTFIPVDVDEVLRDTSFLFKVAH